MTTLTESRAAGEFIISEANGHRSRSQAVVKSGENLKAGHVVGIVTSTGKVVEWTSGATNGSQNVAGVMFAPVDAAGADAYGTLIVRDAEVTRADLTFFSAATAANKNTAVAELEALGIIAR